MHSSTSRLRRTEPGIADAPDPGSPIVPAVLRAPTVLVAELNLIALVEASVTLRLDGPEGRPHIVRKVGRHNCSPALIRVEEFHSSSKRRLGHADRLRSPVARSRTIVTALRVFLRYHAKGPPGGNALHAFHADTSGRGPGHGSRRACPGGRPASLTRSGSDRERRLVIVRTRGPGDR